MERLIPEACMFDILALPEKDLKKVLHQASTRSLAKLVIAYPRTFGLKFRDILCQCLSAPTIEFFHEELGVAGNPSYRDIQLAEMELMKIIRHEHLEWHVSSGLHAISPAR